MKKKKNIMVEVGEIVDNAKLYGHQDGRLNLLFVEGNRRRIDRNNVLNCYHLLMGLDYLPDMPIEYLPMEQAVDRLQGRRLFRATLVPVKGKGEAAPDNFKVRLTPVNPDEYAYYDGVCIDGQSRILALQFAPLAKVKPTYKEVRIPQGMDMLAYAALRNNGKAWSSTDFIHSGLTAGDGETDHILTLCRRYKAAFIFALYSLGTADLTACQVRAMLLGYKRIGDFPQLRLDQRTHQAGDRLLALLAHHPFLTADRFNGTFARGVKRFYLHTGGNLERVADTLTLIDKDLWNKYFTPVPGQYMSAKDYADALRAVSDEYEGRR